MKSLPTAHLLVVDDEQSVLETLTTILAKEGYDVSAAPSAETALELLHTKEPFDVVLADLRMEVQSGRSLIAEIQRNWSDTTTIVLTGYASVELAIEALQGGAYDFLIKPCHVEELKATVARAVERGALARALRERAQQLDEANAKLRSLSGQLQERVEEATAEISAKLQALAHAKHDLEEAERQRLDFTAVVAHELNQPLTTISGSAQLLARDSLPAEVEQRARSTIITETRRLARLVQDLTDASELASGRFQVQLSSCDLAEVIREQVELITVSGAAKNVTFEVTRIPPRIACDTDRLSQVVSNLLANAMKYAPGSSIRVNLRSETDRLILTVADDGPGIPEDRQEAIFEPRVRLSETDGGRAQRGRGLGLYIARGIVEAHGGRIWATSGKTGGTTFTVELPVRELDSDEM